MSKSFTIIHPYSSDISVSQEAIWSNIGDTLARYLYNKPLKECLGTPQTIIHSLRKMKKIVIYLGSDFSTRPHQYEKYPLVKCHVDRMLKQYVHYGGEYQIC